MLWPYFLPKILFFLLTTMMENNCTTLYSCSGSVIELCFNLRQALFFCFDLYTVPVELLYFLFSKANAIIEKLCEERKKEAYGSCICVIIHFQKHALVRLCVLKRDCGLQLPKSAYFEMIKFFIDIIKTVRNNCCYISLIRLQPYK